MLANFQKCMVHVNLNACNRLIVLLDTLAWLKINFKGVWLAFKFSQNFDNLSELVDRMQIDFS